MKIYNKDILENNFIEFSLEGSCLIINNTNYNNIYTVMISFFNSSYSIKGFDFYERNIFNLYDNSLYCIEFIKLNSKYYELKLL